jgi:hypothetical protein
MLRTIVAGILIFTVTSCTTWKPVSLAPERYIRIHDPDAIWVQLQDGSALVLGRPRVFLDTLRGINGGGYRSIPLTNVVQLRAEEPSNTKTALLIASLVVIMTGVYWTVHSDH